MKMMNNLWDDEPRMLLEEIWERLDKFHKLTGLEYDHDETEYVMPNVNEIDCDDEMLESISCAYNDIGYYLGK